ncbi:MAG: DUF1553 domain-containing protein [Pirellulaceae bacterium]|nr:DUF1553 domain-containing protein [Pirellulaceae bacterium]
MKTFPCMRALFILAVLKLALGCSISLGNDLIQFNRDVRPILSNNCFQCHGPDEQHREAELRLDGQEGIEAAFGSAGLAESEGWKRIISSDSDLQMPPPESHKELSTTEINILKRWIEQGGRWQDHWSFVAPQRPTIPQTSLDKWVINPIDAFVANRMESRGLSPSPPAERARWLRRVTFDLTGLPPTVEQIDDFLNDRSMDAYERVVDRLLESDHFGERMALAWMDAARFGDTSVYHADGPRDMWPWRDWVIRAYNNNLPFDRFTIEQIAGDLLPDSTIDQKVAAGFNRNHGTTDEGGAIAEEYRVEYIVDRVKTTSTVWMGLTMECAQCHDHKYDPISQQEYYQFFAFFNQSTDKGMQTRNGNAEPRIDVFDPLNRFKQRAVQRQLESVKSEREAHLTTIGSDFQNWLQQRSREVDARPRAPDDFLARFTLDHESGKQVDNEVIGSPGGRVEGEPKWIVGKLNQAFRCDDKTYLNLGKLADFERTDAFSYGAWLYAGDKVNGAPIARMDDGNSHRGFDLYWYDGHVSVHLVHQWPENAIKVTTTEKFVKDKWQHVMVSYDGSSLAKGITIFVNGENQPVEINHDKLQSSIRTDKPLLVGRRQPGSPFGGAVDDIRVYGRKLETSEVRAIRDFDPVFPLLRIAADERTEDQVAQIREYYLKHHDAVAIRLAKRIDELIQEEKKLAAPVSTVMTMQDAAQPRMTYVLNRGSYDAPQKDQPVQPGVLQALPPIPDDVPANRLGLAKWLVSGEHPLTARVAVNRYWSLFFGEGVVGTLGDFGSQGDWPTHPALLDWLADEFVASGWDVKYLIRQIVTSATYRQSSRATVEARSLDPENRWFGRGPRFRLQGEFIRDNALAASGLLVSQIGGPSTKPYQPDGLWNEVSLSGNVRFKQDQGGKLYRRSMYIYWKRSSPMPVMTIFDAPTREKCVMRRSRTNTPLQALVTMNGPQFVEAARKLADRSIREAKDSTAEQITYGYRLATGCRPTADTLSVLLQAYEDELAVFNDSPERAEQLLAIGDSKRNPTIALPRHAAMTMVMSLILNLDETLTRG